MRNACYRGVTFGEGAFVVVGCRNTRLTLTNAVAWTNWSRGEFPCLHGLTFGKRTFVSVRDSGAILTSADGAPWNQESSPTCRDLKSVAYGNGGFVAVGFWERSCGLRMVSI